MSSSSWTAFTSVQVAHVVEPLGGTQALGLRVPAEVLHSLTGRHGTCTYWAPTAGLHALVTVEESSTMLCASRALEESTGWRDLVGKELRRCDNAQPPALPRLLADCKNPTLNSTAIIKGGQHLLDFVDREAVVVIDTVFVLAVIPVALSLRRARIC